MKRRVDFDCLTLSISMLYAKLQRQEARTKSPLYLKGRKHETTRKLCLVHRGSNIWYYRPLLPLLLSFF